GVDRPQHPRVREAAAQHAGQRLLNLGVARRGVLIEESLRRQDDAAEAKAALRRLLVDERFLNRVRVVRRTETFERGDLGAVHRADRRDARADRAAADDDRAGAALPEAAAEFRAPKREIVAQD